MDRGLWAGVCEEGAAQVWKPSTLQLNPCKLALVLLYITGLKISTLLYLTVKN